MSFPDAAITSAWAIAGGIFTRSLPGAILPNQNTGWMGYGLKIATAAIGSGLVGKFTKSSKAASGFLAGGLVMVTATMIQDFLGYNLVQFASYDVANPMAVPSLSGQYVNSPYVLPTNSLAAAPAGMGRAYGRIYGRRSYN